MLDFIFDIDGTIADIEHRQVLLRQKKKDWKRFKELIADDTPYHDIVGLMCVLHRGGARLVLCTGRERGSEYDQTLLWLKKHEILPIIANKPNGDPAIYMRETEDYRDDALVKLELYDQIIDDGFDPLMVFDDRQRVVDMWRANGIRCLQVQPGLF